MIPESILHDLRVWGHTVSRCDFPPAPLPGLWMVSGLELTEQQVMSFWDAKRIEREAKAKYLNGPLST